MSATPRTRPVVTAGRNVLFVGPTTSAHGLPHHDGRKKYFNHWRARCGWADSRDRKLIFLSFRPLKSGSAVLVRGTHFRICSDGTLRGPDNTTAARYFEGLWYLGQRRHMSFECAGPIYLRVITNRGQRECMGPFASIRAAGGAIFASDNCLGVHFCRAQSRVEIGEIWQEVSFLISNEQN
jgi:hypothetical protein